MKTLSISRALLSFSPFAGVIVLFSGACSQLSGLNQVTEAACPEIRPDVNAIQTNYSPIAEANIKLRAFVQASKDLAALSAQAEAEAAEACTRIGYDIGLSQAQMAPQNSPGGKAAGPCDAVANAIDAIFRSGLMVRVNATPPQCQASGQAYAQCAGSCQVQVDPGQIVARCEPAKLSGYCQGQCGGQCEGRCNGQCNGQCSAVDAMGRCTGQCNGQCVGSCDAVCHANCNGTWQAPKCEGYVQGPSADAQCDASCRAHASFRASCTPGAVNVQSNANTEMAARLSATLQRNLPLLIHAEYALGKRIYADAEMLAKVGAELPNSLGQAGAHAFACAAAGANASAQAMASLRVSISVSAKVSGRVGVGAN